MNKKILQLKGENHEDLEKKLEFTHYLETKHSEGFKRVKVKHEDLVRAFLKFNEENELNTVKFQGGIIQGFLTLTLEEIEKELNLLKENKGKFSSPEDDESAISFGFFTHDYIAEFMQDIIFFSGKKNFVLVFSSVLNEFNIKHFPPSILPGIKIEPPQLKHHKIGRNEPCHCGSGKKYKKCCIDKDIQEGISTL